MLTLVKCQGSSFGSYSEKILNEVFKCKDVKSYGMGDNRVPRNSVGFDSLKYVSGKLVTIEIKSARYSNSGGVMWQHIQFSENYDYDCLLLNILTFKGLRVFAISKKNLCNFLPGNVFGKSKLLTKQGRDGGEQGYWIQPGDKFVKLAKNKKMIMELKNEDDMLRFCRKYIIHNITVDKQLQRTKMYDLMFKNTGK